MKHHSDVRRRLEQFAANARCEANALAAVLGVRMADVARAEGVVPSEGQSPFAIARGKTFERGLYADDARVLREALARAGVLGSTDVAVSDLRLRAAGGSLPHLDAARASFERLLRDLASRGATESLIVAPAMAVPGNALADGLLAIDVLTVHPGADGAIALRVGEIKAYPDRGGYTDPTQLATSRAQAGLYLHVLRELLRALGLTPPVRAADDGFLVLTRAGGNAPSVRAREDLRWQARRAEALFARLRDVADAPIAVRAANDAPDAPLAAIRAAETRYEPSCASFCARAAACRRRAEACGDPAVLGPDVARLLGATTLDRAAALLDGRVSPADAREEDLLRRLTPETKGAIAS